VVAFAALLEDDGVRRELAELGFQLP
jgi:hypothetical protein